MNEPTLPPGVFPMIGRRFVAMLFVVVFVAAALLAVVVGTGPDRVDAQESAEFDLDGSAPTLPMTMTMA